MILSDREIKLALRRDLIRITPLPPDRAISSTAVDLTLDEQLSFWPRRQAEPEGALVVYPSGPDFDVVALLREQSTTIVIPSNGFLLQPGAFALGWTVERIRLPHSSRLAARVEGRSSLARLGIGVHVTAPTIHAGFGATHDTEHLGTPIQLEIWNCGPLHVCLQKGMIVCQLILEEVHGTPEKGYEGMFAVQAPETAGPPASGPATPPRKRRRR